VYEEVSAMSKKFLVLYKSSASAGEQMAAGSPDQAQEAMGLWMAWMEKAGPALVDPGSPLGEATEVPSVAGQSGRHVGGYSILQGESAEDIKKLLDGHPHYHSPDATIEVHEFLAMPGTS
jgi:hypothetical protein